MSTQTKWTPGPWRIDEANRTLVARLVGGEYEYICSVDPEEFSVSDMTDEENRANATLIAAAPELYEALEDLLGYFRSGNAVDVERATIKANAPEVLAARAALKKARGE